MAGRVLTDDQIASWRDRGFIVVHATESTNAGPGQVLTANEATRFREAAWNLGNNNKPANNGTSSPGDNNRTSFGGASFPFLDSRFEALNELVLHERVFLACSELLGNSKLLVSQGEAWLKHGRAPEAKAENNNLFYDNDDQRIHMDFPNHYLVVPPPWSRPDAVAMIVYFDDARECGGRTALVPRQGPEDDAYKYPYTKMPGFGMLPWINNKTLAERDLETRDPEAHAFRKELYKREEYLDFRVGTILFYRLDLWHRGTPLLHGKSRAVCNMMLKTQESGIRLTSWHVGWATNAYNSWTNKPPTPPERGRFEVLLEKLERWQRELLGFPREDDEYWTDDTIGAVRARYPKIKDVGPKL